MIFNMAITKSQTATEFIIILSFILVLILSFVGSFNILHLGSSNSESKLSSTLWDSEDLVFKGYRINETNITVVLKNNLPYDLNITNISLDNLIYSDNFILSVNSKYNYTLKSNNSVFKSVVVNYKNLENNMSLIFVGQDLYVYED